MLMKLCHSLKQTVILFLFANALSVKATYYFTPETQFIEAKPSSWSDSWRVSLRGPNALLEPIFEGQWTEAVYQNHRLNDIVVGWINDFNKNPFPGTNLLDDLSRCTGDHPNQSRSWTHPTHHGIQVVGPCNGQIVMLDFSNFPLADNQLFTVKLYGDGVEWQSPWDDGASDPMIHQCSLPNGYVLRKKTSSENFRRIHFQSPALSQRFALLIQGTGIGSRDPHRWGSILCLYYVTKNSISNDRSILESVLWQNLRSCFSSSRVHQNLIQTLADAYLQDVNSVDRVRLLQRENYMQHFIGKIPALQRFTPEDIEKESSELGKGGAGSVYPGRIKNTNQDIIVKKLKPGSNPKFLETELNASEALKQRLNHRLSDLSEDVVKFQGFSGVVTILGLTADGHLVQERVHGKTLDNLLRHPEDGAFYDERLGGFPQDLMEAKRKALELAAIVQSIHSLGMLHGDLFLRNIMLDDKGHIRVIDLGLCAENCSRPVREDILREMFLLHAVFFGAIYIKAGYPENVTKSQEWLKKYLEGKSLEQRKAYFLSQCRDLNRQMRNQTSKILNRPGKAYSDETIRRLSRLMAQMADPNPDIRPNDKEICEELTEIWLLPEG
jgi:hypothetical protein